MKVILSLAVFLSGTWSLASEKIIDYAFQNQITGSSLTVFEDGTVTHFERVCCPPRAEQITEKSLDQQTIDHLLHLIAAAANGSQSRFTAGSSGAGSNSGSLTAYNSEGEAINIRTIEFGDGAGGPQPVIFNTAPESREIEKFVYDKVQKKMNY